jgi:hypothetical protein
VSQRPRRRSRNVALVAVPVLALAFSACGDDDDTAYCVDESDRIVENQSCDEDANRGSSGGGGAFFWYYGGGGGRLTPGTRLKGGDRVAASNIAENARRGGFGSGSKPSASGVGRSSSSGSGGG